MASSESCVYVGLAGETVPGREGRAGLYRSRGGEAGWDVVIWVNTDWAKANPGTLPRLVKMYQDYANVMMTTPDDADGIISSEKYIPAGTISTAINSKRLSIVVNPTWEADANRQLWQMFDLGLKEGFLTAAADRGTVISEAPKP